MPRIVFVGKDGSVRKDLFNPLRAGEYRYFFPKATDVVKVMTAALKQ